MDQEPLESQQPPLSAPAMPAVEVAAVGGLMTMASLLGSEDPESDSELELQQQQSSPFYLHR